MNTTLIVNPKGGSGKTTVAINLASYFAATRAATTIMDYDPQGSSLNWLALRAPQAPPIRGANATRQKGTRLRSMAMYVPPETEQLIIDAPAACCGVALQEMLERAKCIVIPLVPSAIDIHATGRFIKEVLLTAKMRSRNVPVAIVANKVRRSMPAYRPLEHFLESLELELTARLIDSDVYVKAAETGLGLFEMDLALSVAERKQFMPLAEWVEGNSGSALGARRAEHQLVRSLDEPGRVVELTALRQQRLVK
ncbi:MAG: ParA family protein [Betaproteobacteria bacterium]|nr:MAG: ParA family protein [Betaproteobacteria bacterium]